MNQSMTSSLVYNIPGVEDPDDLPDTPDKDEQNEISKEIKKRTDTASSKAVIGKYITRYRKDKLESSC